MLLFCNLIELIALNLIRNQRTYQAMNIAQKIKDHYESDDFKDNYAIILFEDRSAVVERIHNIIANEYYFEKKYKFRKYYILDNLEEFTTVFNGFYVGHTSIDSVQFGEQEEQLEGLRNHATNKNYTLPYLKKIFEKEDFYVHNNYAYMDLQGGMHVDMLIGDLTKLFKTMGLITN